MHSPSYLVTLCFTLWHSWWNRFSNVFFYFHWKIWMVDNSNVYMHCSESRVCCPWELGRQPFSWTSFGIWSDEIPGGSEFPIQFPSGGSVPTMHTPTAPLSSLTRAVPLGRSDWVQRRWYGEGVRLVSGINHIEYKILDRWSRKKAGRLPCDQCFATNPIHPSGNFSTQTLFLICLIGNPITCAAVVGMVIVL